MSDLSNAQHDIDTMVARLRFLRAHLVDVHAMGFRAGGKNLDTGSFARRQEYYGDEVGRPDCRDAWAHLALWLRQPSTTKLVNIVTAWEKILADGTLTPQRGATITVEEYEHALAMQAKRGGGPTKILPQPKHPGKK